MSWKLGKRSPKPTTSATLTPEDAAGRSTTPTPDNPNGDDNRVLSGGLLTIRMTSAEGLALPAGTAIPAVVEAALASHEAKIAESVSPSSVTQQRLAKKGHQAKDSIQRVQCWWLPYIVMEFDVNQVLITPLGGSIEAPVYMYATHL